MKIVKQQMMLHHSVSVIGGYIGGYTIFNFADVFVNAQTGNLLRLVHSLCEGAFGLVPFLVLSFFTYASGCVFYSVARKYLKLSMKIISFIVTALAVAAVGLLCGASDSLLAVLPLVFAMPIQWNAFKKAGGNSSSTIFSSNNVRQAVMLLTKYFLDRDKKDLRNAAFYWRTLLFFHLGAAASCLLSLWLGKGCIWLCLVPIAVSAAFYCRYRLVKAEVFHGGA